MTLNKILFTLGAACLLNASPLLAQQSAIAPGTNTSAYSSIDLDTCHLITNEEMGLPPMSEEEEGVGSAAWLCIGYNQAIVYVSEGDLRMFVSYGPNAAQEIAANQTLPAFNFTGDILEWRLRTDLTPFATIHSLHTESGEVSEIKGEILIVTKLEPGNICHIAYIDVNMPVLANQNYDPHQIARDFADAEAANFNCKTDDIFKIPS